MYPIASILDRHARGKLTRGNAVRMLALLGVPEGDAASMLDDRDGAA